MKQVNDMRQRERKITGKLAQNVPGRAVALAQCGGQVLCFSAGGATDGTCQQAVRFLVAELADSGVDGPAGAARFDGGAVAVEKHVAELDFAGGQAVIDAPAGDDAPANPAAQGAEEDGI